MDHIGLAYSNYQADLKMARLLNQVNKELKKLGMEHINFQYEIEHKNGRTYISLIDTLIGSSYYRQEVKTKDGAIIKIAIESDESRWEAARKLKERKEAEEAHQYKEYLKQEELRATADRALKEWLLQHPDTQAVIKHIKHITQ